MIATICAPRQSFGIVALYVSLVMLCLTGVAARAAVLDVPAPYSTIQAAIDAANPGDEVVIAAGTYLENINFNGKAITVRSTDPTNPTVVAATVIDGQDLGSVVTFASAEGANSVLSGLTITNGKPAESGGGGISCHDSSPTITNNTITGNEGWGGGGGIYSEASNLTISNNTISDNSVSNLGYGGGGIFCYGGNPTITNNAISGNSASGDGGGISCCNCSPTIANNTITGNSAVFGGGICSSVSNASITNNTISANSASFDGGGIYCYASSPTIAHNTITDNSATGSGGGIYCWNSTNVTLVNSSIIHNSAGAYGGGIASEDSSVTMFNCIVVFSATGAGIYTFAGSSPPTVSYCNVYSNAAGNYDGMPDPTGTAGNISQDPLFADWGSGDYHLKSTVGRWNPSTASWVTDPVHSPCIDAGDPSSPYPNEPVPNGGRINMGAYGNTAEASRASGDPVPPAPPTDLSAGLAGPTQVDLTWTDNADNEDGFTLQRRKYDSTDGWPAAWATVKWLGANATSRSDTSLTEDGQYQYRVRAYNAIGPSNWAPTTRIIVCSTRPPTPSNFAAQMADDNTARLTWTDNSDINKGFTLQRRQWDTVTGWPAAWTTRRWLGPNVETYDDTLTEEGIYQYRVRAYNAIGPSNWARPCYLTRATATPDAPSDLTLTAVATGIRADWTANANNAQGYTLQKRKQNPDGTWPDFAPPAKWLGPTVQSFTDTNLSGPGTYQYRVRAYNAEGPSNWSSYAKITYAGALGMPGALCSVAVTQANGDFVSIVYGLSSNADIAIDVRNIAGRMIRAIPCGTASAGLNTATWNLRNSSGASVPSGMYLCTITARTAAGTQATAVRTVTIRR